MSQPSVRIHYHRPPDRKDLFVQPLVHAADDVIVTYMPATPLARPLRVDGEVVLEDGSPAIWFTFPGACHDIGRFHRADGTFTGVYANIITPVTFTSPTEWSTTDLFLDIWVGADGTIALLDEDEFIEALQNRWLDEGTAQAAREEAARLLELCTAGEWPPPVIEEWTLERVRHFLAGRRPNGGDDGTAPGGP